MSRSCGSTIWWSGPWADPLTFSFPYSAPIPAAARLGQLAGGIHGGVLVLAAAALLLIAVDRGLRWGYELRVAGDAPRAAIYGGISPVRTILTGARSWPARSPASPARSRCPPRPAGCRPVSRPATASWRSWSPGSPPAIRSGIVLASILYAGLQNGGFALQVAGIPPAITVVLQAVLLLAALAAVGLGRYRVRLVPRRSGARG